MPLEPTLRDLIVGAPVMGAIDDALIARALAASLGPLLLERVQLDGVELPTSERERLGIASLRAQQAAHRQASRLGELRLLASAHDAELFVIKGLWNGNRLYAQAWQRVGADIDLVVSHWSTGQRRGFFGDLGVPLRRVDAFERLIAAGRPLHEMTIKSGSRELPNLDCHTNPTGLVGPALTLSLEFAVHRELVGAGRVLGPSDELALLIALVNLARKGGMQLQAVADVVRLVQTDQFEWARFVALAKAERLFSISQQVLWAIFDDLDWRPAGRSVPRPSRRSIWAPHLGARMRRPARALTHVARGRETRVRDVGDVVRWYLPSRAVRTARRST